MNGLFGHYPGLFVSLGDHRIGKNYCRVCGGRTQQRDKKGKACHASCAGKKS